MDILKQLFENLSDTDKQVFLTSISQKEQVTKVIQPKQITNCPHCQSTHFVKNGTRCNNQRYLVYHNFVNFSKDSKDNKELIF